MTYASRLALDYVSVRSFDQDGRLRVAEANISKAAVNPYGGDEIPGWEKLGLDPGRVYLLYRHPDELAKSAPTFANVPVLARHVPVSPEDHKPADVVGCVGSDVRFDPPFLKASMIVWAGTAIDRIRLGACRELSCGYRYAPIMRPGRTPDGDAYDGLMTRIMGNHLALVEQGRCGPECVVGDGMAPTSSRRALLQQFPHLERLRT